MLEAFLLYMLKNFFFVFNMKLIPVLKATELLLKSLSVTQ